MKKPITIILILLLLCGCSMAPTAPQPTPVPTPEATPTAEIPWEPELVFTTVDSEGREWTDRCFQEASLTMLNLWAYWCPPCVGELPDLQKLADAYADRGFRILGVSEKDYEQQNIQTIQELGITYPCLRLPDGLEETLNTGYIPTTVFVNGEGKLVGDTLIGSRSYDDWAKIIEELLG